MRVSSSTRKHIQEMARRLSPGCTIELGKFGDPERERETFNCLEVDDDSDLLDTYLYSKVSDSDIPEVDGLVRLDFYLYDRRRGGLSTNLVVDIDSEGIVAAWTPAVIPSCLVYTRKIPRITVFDINEDLCRALTEELVNLPVRVHHGSYTDPDATEGVDGKVALVSPANSLGLMGGGIDGHYSRTFPGVADAVRGRVDADGYIPVGEAITTPLPEVGLPYTHLVSAPTMPTPGCRIPPQNVEEACMAAVAEARVRGFDHVFIPGMGTGVGGVSPKDAAHAMRVAIVRTLTQLER